jgi:large subunit ribosomal protein L29
MLASDLKKLPEQELHAKVHEIRERLFHLGFKAGTEEVTNPHEVREIRRDIARIQQVLGAKAAKSKPAHTSRATRVEKNLRAECAKMKAARQQPAAAHKPKGPKAAKAPAQTSTPKQAAPAKHEAAASKTKVAEKKA